MPLLRAASTGGGGASRAHQDAGSSRWGVPGGKKARKGAKDSVDGGPVKVPAEDEVTSSHAHAHPCVLRLHCALRPSGVGG